MEDQNLTRQHRCNQRNLLTVKLVLKTPKQDFLESMLQTIANVTTIDLKIIDKLKGGNSECYDWCLVEVSGTFDDLVLTINCWQELGVEKCLSILA
jgi:hypothetical protein